MSVSSRNKHHIVVFSYRCPISVTMENAVRNNTFVVPSETNGHQKYNAL